MHGFFVTINAEVSLPLHRHEDARIIVVLEGEVHENDLSGKRVYRKGEVLFRPPFCAHANAGAGAPSSYLRLPVSQKAWKRCVLRYGWRGMRGGINFDARDHRAMLQSRTGGDQILALLTANGRPANDGHDGRALVHGSFAALAAVEGLEPYQLTRRFQRAFGLTPSAWRREWRLRRAFLLMAAGNAALADVAADCGFSDQSHFSREVKRATGLAPSEFKRFAQG